MTGSSSTFTLFLSALPFEGTSKQAHNYINQKAYLYSPEQAKTRKKPIEKPNQVKFQQLHPETGKTSKIKIGIIKADKPEAQNHNHRTGKNTKNWHQCGDTQYTQL